VSYVTRFTILGEVPDGGPGPDTSPALRSPIPSSQVDAVLSVARDVILTATGSRDGVASKIDVRLFDPAIRAYMPLGHYERSPDQAISVMDYKMYACRVVHRLLNQIAGRRVEVAGAYSSHLATNARANALYEALRDFEQRGPQLEQRQAREADQRLAEAWTREETHRATRDDMEQRLRRELSDELEQRLRGEIEQRLREELARTMTREPVGVIEVPPRAANDDPPWTAQLTDAGARDVFRHLAAHGSVTEAEVIAFLGSPRAYRKFSLEFEQHAQNVPFRVRIEPAADGKRYVKEGEI
jgi:hypothetical protein